MNAKDVNNALAAWLAADPSLGTIVWEDQEALPTPPYIVYENVRVGANDPTLTGGGLVLDGFLMLTVVTNKGGLGIGATSLADDLAGRFPYGLRIAVVGGGHALVNTPPFVMQGFTDGIHWRTPVRVDYEAYGPSAFSNTPVPTPGDGEAPYQFVQVSALLSWTVNHNLGWKPQVTILTLGGLEIDAAISHTSDNQFIVTFATAQAGYAIYE